MADTTTIERSIVIDPPAAEIAPHLAGLHSWVAWSPWEGQDPNLKRTYTGTEGAVGSTYAWSGNRKAGAGTMLVTRIDPAEIDIDLNFSAPFTSSSKVEFRLAETGPSTTLVWSMQRPMNFMAKVMGLVMNMDKLIGSDFEKGLARLKAVVEAK